MHSTKFEAGALPSNQYAFKNLVYFNPEIFNDFLKKNGGVEPVFVRIDQFVLKANPLQGIEEQSVGLSSLQRDMMKISKLDKFDVKIEKIREHIFLSAMEISVDMLFFNEALTTDKGVKIQEQDILEQVQLLFKDKYLNKGEQFLISLLNGDVILKAIVDNVEVMASSSTSFSFGMVEEQTRIKTKVVSKPNQKLKVEMSQVEEKKIFKQNFNFQELGIGGLDKEFQEIFRRAFNSRRYPQQIIEKYGIKHVKGMLLYGPPGTGKTLIARQIAKALDCKEPKIVNGPEIFDKYVGGSEKKIRELFAEAEKEQQMKGDESQLHIIIFDEIDAICRSRGSTGNSGTGVNETVVNQLLSKLDGVDSLNNILVIGMTNRKDMIDEAMLRPGRLEIHLEIGLPDENGRKQIFEIHTRHMVKNDLIDDSVNLNKLAKITKNYTGAEIEAVCRSATSFALFKDIDLSNIQAKEGERDKNKKPVPQKKGPSDQDKYNKKVTMYDFELALNEIKPAFGVNETDLSNSIRGGIIEYGDRFNSVYKNCNDFIKEINNSQSTPLLSILLEGAHGCGKSALAAKLALNSQFPFVKIISPESFVGYSELAKISQIVKIFDDAYKSPLSLIVLDDIERLIEFIHIGPRFSNPILQALLVLIKKKPTNQERKLMIIGTTSLKDILKEMEVVDCFNVCMNVPSLKRSNEISAILAKYNCSTEVSNKICNELTQVSGFQGIPIKDLMLSIDLSLQKSKQGKIEHDQFMESYQFVTQHD